LGVNCDSEVLNRIGKLENHSMNVVVPIMISLLFVILMTGHFPAVDTRGRFLKL